MQAGAVGGKLLGAGGGGFMLLFVRPEDQAAGARRARAISSPCRSDSRCPAAASCCINRTGYDDPVSLQRSGARRVRSRHAFAFHRDELVAWYRAMLRIRRIEEEIERRYHQDQMKTPIHLVIGQEAAAVGCCSALRRDRSRLHQPSHTRRLSRERRRSGPHAVRDALPHQRLRGIARRLDAPHRQVGRHGRHLGHRRRCRTDRNRRRARSENEARRSGCGGVHRRRDDRRRRGGRKPELRGAEESCPSSSSAKTTSIRCSRRSPRASRRATSAPGPKRTACRRSSVDGVNVLAVHDAVACRGGARASGRRSDVRRSRGLSIPRAWRRRRRQQDRLSRRSRANGVGGGRSRCRCSAKYLTRSAQLDAVDVRDDGRRDRRRDRATRSSLRSRARTQLKRISTVTSTQTEPCRGMKDSSIRSSTIAPTRARAASCRTSRAINEALTIALEQDPNVFVLGQGVDDPTAMFGTTKDLAARFGPDRVFDTPLVRRSDDGRVRQAPP